MLALTLVLVGFLAFTPQVVLSKFNTITFSSIQQCGPFNVSFSGGVAPSALPLSLTIVPFNSTPISIVIPDSSWNATSNTGAAVTFIPLAAGETFIASLDDANGQGTGLVSDVIVIEDSTTTSCLATKVTPPPRLYTVDQAVSQCDPFNVTVNTTAGATTPTIRAFVPRLFSFPVNQTSNTNLSGIATYTMDAFRGAQVALLMQDAAGHKETSGLMTVDGNDGSSSSCLKFNSSAISTSKPSVSAQATPTSTTADSTTTNKLSSGAVVAISIVSGSLVGVIAIVMVIYVYRERRRRRMPRQNNSDLEISRSEKRPPANLRITSPVIDKATRYAENPPYISNEFFTSPTSPDFLQYPRRSEAPGVYKEDRSPGPRGSSGSYAPEPSQNEKRRPSGQTLRSIDIEQMLERATVYTQDQPREQDRDDRNAQVVSRSPGSVSGVEYMYSYSPRSPARSIPYTPRMSLATDMLYSPTDDRTRLSASGPWISRPPRVVLSEDRIRTSFRKKS